MKDKTLFGDHGGPVDAGELFGGGAESGAVVKRGAGRPKGSKNKRDTDIIEYLQAMGYQDPLHGNAALYSMDPVDLAYMVTTMREELRQRLLDAGNSVAANQITSKPVDIMEVINVQQIARRDSLTYWHAKKTPEDAPPPTRLPVMQIGELNVNVVKDDGTLSAGNAPDGKTIENQPLDDVESVRHDKIRSHKTDKPLK